MNALAEPVASATPETNCTLKAYLNAQRARAIDRLRKGGLTAGDTVYVILRHVGKSGRTRFYNLYTIKDKKTDCITWDAGIVLDKNFSRGRQAIRVNHCNSEAAGCDLIGRNLVRELAKRVFNNGGALEYSG